MKKLLILLSAIGLLVACTDGNKGGVTAIRLNKASINLDLGYTETLVATLEPAGAIVMIEWDAKNRSVVSVGNTGEVTGVGVGTTVVVAKAGDLKAECTVTVTNPAPEGAIDLGLSVYWATCNLGASKPEEYGGYYSWGETETKTDYTWATYKWGNGDTDKKQYTKYNTRGDLGPVDNKTVLDPEDDAAHVNLGGKWRMPTDAEFKELIEQCTWETVSGGRRVRSKKNKNYIFLPNTGYWLRDFATSVGVGSSYWSSNILSEYPNAALGLYFRDGSLQQDLRQDNSDRNFGFPIRPVIDK